MKISFASCIRNKGLLSQSGLYKIVNTINGHWYIGSTNMGFAKRFCHHRQILRKGSHPNYHIQNSYNKYGEKAFVFIIVKIVPKHNLLDYEQKIIDKHFGKPYFYNMSRDVSASFDGRKHSEETKKKISISLKKQSKEIGMRTRLARLGTKHPAETIEKMRVSAKNRDDSNRLAALRTPEHRAKISKITKGRKLTPEQVQQMIIRNANPEYRRKMSLACKGIEKQESTKNLMSVGRLGRQVILKHEDGTIEEIISLRKFEEKYKIDRKITSQIVHGKIESFKGWSLVK